ncbi:MAG: hypothetical protein NZZ41_07140 [Candidatus Dojkabacteria bacterium]|nr:hypothetical protein [Candidatus Dojkabacteria bacterium]
MSLGEFPNTAKALIPNLNLDQTFFESFSFNYNNGLVVGSVWVYHLFDTPTFDLWYGYAEFIQNNVPSGYVEFSIPAPSIQAKQLGFYNSTIGGWYKGFIGSSSTNTSWISFRNQQIFMRVYQNINNNNMMATGANCL